MSEIADIDQLYGQIFGKEKRPGLFEADDEKYLSLRNEIINAKREYNPQKLLPFTEIRLYPYEVYSVKESVRRMSEEVGRIFFTRKYEGKDLTTFAAAYYDFENSQFVVLKNSFFVANDYSQNLIRKQGTEAFVFKRGKYVQKEDVAYDSASWAASLFLGCESDFKEWKDREGKTLYEYITNGFFKGNSAENQTEFQATAQKENISPIPRELNTSRQNVEKKTFFIGNTSPQRQCNAFGYYNAETHKFVLQAGSLLVQHCSDSYELTPAGYARQQFLYSNCQKEQNGYLLKKDFVCNTPSGAASLVLGRSTNGWHEWKDDNGRTLDSVYRK